MHWFLWILFLFQVVGVAIRLARLNGWRPPSPTTFDLCISVMAGSIIAMGILVYGGLV